MALAIPAEAAPPPAPPPPVPPPVVRPPVIRAPTRLTFAEVDRYFRESRDFGATFNALHEAYPDDYSALINRIVEAAAGGTPAAAQREGFLFMRRLTSAHGAALARAPDEDLRALGTAYQAFTEALQGYSIPLCAQFTMTGFSPGLVLPPDLVRRMDTVNALQIRAMRRGEDAPPRAAMDADAQRLWVERLWAIDPDSAAALNNPANATPEQQCQAGIALYRAANDLPAHVSASVLATLFQASLRLQADRAQ
jgi:hypothetical protein